MTQSKAYIKEKKIKMERKEAGQLESGGDRSQAEAAEMLRAASVSKIKKPPAIPKL